MKEQHYLRTVNWNALRKEKSMKIFAGREKNQSKRFLYIYLRVSRNFEVNTLRLWEIFLLYNFHRNALRETLKLRKNLFWVGKHFDLIAEGTVWKRNTFRPSTGMSILNRRCQFGSESLFLTVFSKQIFGWIVAPFTTAIITSPSSVYPIFNFLFLNQSIQWDRKWNAECGDLLDKFVCHMKGWVGGHESCLSLEIKCIWWGSFTQRCPRWFSS
jgi:hypothetical protein